MTELRDDAAWSAVVLTGGTGRRLGGVDKGALAIADVSLLDHVVGAIPPDVPVVIAGPVRETTRPVTFLPDEPPGSGPVAGISAALAAVSTPFVAVIAVDVPWSVPVVSRLVAELAATADHDVLIPVDADGRRQLLSCAWRTPALREALARLGDPAHRSVRDLVRGARVRELPLSADEAVLLADIDTPADLAREQRRSERPTLDSGPATT